MIIIASRRRYMIMTGKGRAHRRPAAAAPGGNAGKEPRKSSRGGTLRRRRKRIIPVRPGAICSAESAGGAQRVC